MCDKEDKDMPITVDMVKNEKINVNSKKFKSKVPHLNVYDGKVQINENDPLQKKWFEEFKK